MAILGIGVFSILGFILDPLFQSIGYSVLTMESLQGLWTDLYNTPIIALSMFNNTVVMGSLIVALIALIPMFYLMIWFVKYYRDNLDEKIKKLKIVQLVKTSRIYGFYNKFSGGN